MSRPDLSRQRFSSDRLPARPAMAACLMLSWLASAGSLLWADAARASDTAGTSAMEAPAAQPGKPPTLLAQSGQAGGGRFVLGEELPKVGERTGSGSSDSSASSGTASGDGTAAGTAPGSRQAGAGSNEPAGGGRAGAGAGAGKGDSGGAGNTRRAIADEPAPVSSAPRGAGGQVRYTPTDWETLIPPNWEPLQEFKSLDFNSMSDSDPRAIAALRKLQKAWKDAPLNPAIQREKIEISGFIVPLDSSDPKTIEELLLVPYFGACIHVPPPPSNQVIHVTLKKPLKGFQMMDPVTVRGELVPARLDTQYGSAGYRLDAVEVTAYEQPADEQAEGASAGAGAGAHP
ncbi:MAG: DUF3299 domain-containing protein [Lautropia sp.]|nr:DUF3299 domain-containing protein [Lautropia sp.]